VAPDPTTQPSTGILSQNVDQTTQDGVYGSYNLEINFSGVHLDGTQFIFNEQSPNPRNDTGLRSKFALRGTSR
jgi:hypothetical protein